MSRTAAAKAIGSTVRWHEVPDRATLRRTALERILSCSEKSIHERGAFHFVLAGGETPRALYCELREAHAAWAAWHIWFGDERCVPAEDPARNSRMAGESWLDNVAIPPGQIHPIPAELGPQQGALRYTENLQKVGDFDLVLLGLGEDGHTASLFPGRDWGDKSGAPDALPVFDAPKPPPERVTLSAARLSRAREILFLVDGEAKHRAVAAWRRGDSLPVRAIRPPGGVDVLLESTLLVPISPAL
jgi:6-phosphogluconolactonase